MKKIILNSGLLCISFGTIGLGNTVLAVEKSTVGVNAVKTLSSDSLDA
ncbi:hypothetical protein [Lactococcus garvieae]